MATVKVKSLLVNGKSYDFDLEVGAMQQIVLQTENGDRYLLTVDEDGNLITNSTIGSKECIGPDNKPESGETTCTIKTPFLQAESLSAGGLFISSVYCGGVDNEYNDGVTYNSHSLGYCSHNFVELANTTANDISLSGLSLQYTSYGSSWISLPLQGTIKAGETFLIRGSQCSKMDTNTTVIKVKTYDMEWVYADGGAHDGLIQFSTQGAKFYLKYGITPYEGDNPYGEIAQDGKAVLVDYGYIDLMGLDNGVFWNTDRSGAWEGSDVSNAMRKLSNSRLFCKYYTLDPAKAANKEAAKRTTNGLTYMVDLSKHDGDVIRSITAYTPKSSKEHKNFFFNKSLLLDSKPTVITCSFGIKATADDEVSGDMVSFTGKTESSYAGATRCFNWTSKDYYTEYLWIRKVGENTWGHQFESINGSTATYYNRIRQEYPDGNVLTAHKQLIYNIPAGKYEYLAGRANSDGSPNLNACTDVHTFIVDKSSEVNSSGFTFVQTSDQQGFNWDEYQVWKYAAKYIAQNEKNLKFMINTGDMTQNGNRINEWIDYFDGKEELSNMEEMATIGNNDLAPVDLTNLGFGSDLDKINPTNITFYYTFEIDTEIPPIFDVIVGETMYSQLYIPSLYSFNYGNVHFISVNSEITQETENKVLGIKEASASKTGFIYAKIKDWMADDVKKAKDNGCNWIIVYCHEMPFTIITLTTMNAWHTESMGDTVSGGTRSGSHLNIVTTSDNKYWFGEFCQKNGIRLVLGGHKHTQATTWPLKENVSYAEDGTRTVKSMMPIIQLTKNELYNYFLGAEKLITINDSNSPLSGHSYPETWFQSSAAESETVKADMLLNTGINADSNLGIDNNYKPSYAAYFCTFEIVEKESDITGVVYAMSQATGYKHTSNKELPNEHIPWLRYYFPAEDGKSVNAQQRFPFYTIWTVKGNQITGDVKKIGGLFNAKGKFEINVQGMNSKAGVSSDSSYSKIIAVNGNGTNNIESTIQTIIKK